MTEPARPRIAVFFATSGHSGEDRTIAALVPAWAARGYGVDILRVRRHGPSLVQLPAGCREIDLRSRHVYSALPALIRYLRREPPAAIYTGKYRLVLTSLIAFGLARPPTRLCISTGTTVSIDLAGRGWLERRFQRWVMHRWYRRAHALITCAEGVSEDLAAFAELPRDNMQVVPRPVVDPARFDATQSRPDHPWFAAGQPPVIIGVGELSPRKDYATLLRAFAELKRRRDARLIVLGRGREESRLQQLACELGIDDAVQFPGFVRDPLPWLAHAAVFAHTARYEGLGFVLIEALALGTPVVSVDGPHGPREILSGGQHGALVRIGDHAALAAALDATLDATPDRAACRAAVRRYEVEPAAEATLIALGLSARAGNPDRAD